VTDNGVIPTTMAWQTRSAAMSALTYAFVTCTASEVDQIRAHLVSRDVGRGDVPRALRRTGPPDPLAVEIEEAAQRADRQHSARKVDTVRTVGEIDCRL
jgi:hypothetical protein